MLKHSHPPLATLTTLFVVCVLEDGFLDIFISPAEGIGGGKLIEPDPRVEAGEVDRVTLVADDDHVPGGTRELAELCRCPLQQNVLMFLKIDKIVNY